MILETIPGGTYILGGFNHTGQVLGEKPDGSFNAWPSRLGFGDGVSPFPGKMRHQSDQTLFKELKCVWRPMRRRTQRGEVR